jgi:hypothetical protein
MLRRLQVCAAAVALLLVTVSGCSSDQSAPRATGGATGSTVSPSPSRTASSEHILSDSDVKQLNADVNLGADSYLSLAGARPSYRDTGAGGHTMMTIHDVDDSSWQGGMYALQIYCMGTGSWDVRFSIGNDAKETRASCSPDIVITPLSLTTKGASRSEITIIPSNDAASEIAYRVVQQQ